MNKAIDKLKKRKKELGMTNKELSVASGVPYGTVCRVLANNNTGGSANWQTIKDLARAMGMSIEELLDEGESLEPEQAVEEAAPPEPAGPSDEEKATEKTLAAMAQSYEALLDERQNMLNLKDEIIAAKDKWLTRLFITCCVLVGIIVAVMVFDLVNPSLGFFQR